MNPQSPNIPHAILPQPSVDQYPQATAMSMAQPQQPAAPLQQYAPVAPIAQAPAAAMQPATPAAAPPATTPGGTEADDAIWVAKAREIMQGLQADPFAESMELGKLKAAYLKVRYGKEIKTGDDTQQ